MTLPTYDRKEIELPATGSWPGSRHRFDDEQVRVLRAAEAAGRPLLVRGDPGTGKNQLAHAAAVHLGAVSGSTVPADLNAARYIEPGALWWAVDRAGAAAQLAAARLRHRARNAGRRVDAGAARCC